MFRSRLTDLITWKDSGSRKPLIIRGARQTGKTWLMKEFGRTHFARTLYLDFEKNKRLANIFTGDFSIDRIIVALQAETGIKISAPDTLIIFDEIQAVPDAITSLKYFQEDAPDIHLIAAGSLLGLAMHSGISFPVGKVSFMDLYPLSFNEFLDANGENAINEFIQKSDMKMVTAFKDRYIDRLRQYYYVGGMPEAVAVFAKSGDFSAVREIQKQILDTYEHDFSKYAPIEIVPRIRMLWNSVPGQLAKENRKFIYGLVKEGSRAKEYELALSWLIDCGLVKKVLRVEKPSLPLKAYADNKAFKLFIVDTGLMSAMTDIDPRTLLEGNKIFTEFKGALTEQYVFQQLVSAEEYSVFYWSAERSTAEIDFLLQYNNIIIPLEVKAEENLHAKSLKVFHEKFRPAVSFRTSMSDFREQDWLVNIPLYAVCQLGMVADQLVDRL